MRRPGWMFASRDGTIRHIGPGDAMPARTKPCRKRLVVIRGPAQRLQTFPLPSGVKAGALKRAAEGGGASPSNLSSRGGEGGEKEAGPK